MHKGRMEAFSDGVIAIIITIMVLELRPPHGGDLADLLKLWPTFLSYLLSFIYVAIYWNNHHHMLHTVKRVTGPILWANLHLLFWLSVVPFVTAWMGEHQFSTGPMATYGFVLLMNAIAYTILQTVILRAEGRDSLLAKAIGSDIKGKVSVGCYVLGMLASFAAPQVSGALYALVAFIWLIPDSRIERQLRTES